MKAKRITSKNFVGGLKSNDDFVPVRGLQYNQLKNDFDAHIPDDGEGKFDSIGEYTSGNGVNVTGLKQDTIAEKTSGSGVNVDGGLLKDGIFGKVVTVTATTAGTGTGQLSGASQFVKVYSPGVDKVIGLPLLSTALIGTVIRGYTVTGCEIRAMEQATGTWVNDVSGAKEAAISTGTTFRVEAVTANRWILTTVDSTGFVEVVVPD